MVNFNYKLLYKFIMNIKGKIHESWAHYKLYLAAAWGNIHDRKMETEKLIESGYEYELCQSCSKSQTFDKRFIL